MKERHYIACGVTTKNYYKTSKHITLKDKQQTPLRNNKGHKLIVQNYVTFKT